MTPKMDTEDSASTMVSLDTIKMVFLAAELMGLKVLSADITLAYIQAIQKKRTAIRDRIAIAQPLFPVFGLFLGRGGLLEEDPCADGPAVGKPLFEQQLARLVIDLA